MCTITARCLATHACLNRVRVVVVCRPRSKALEASVRISALAKNELAPDAVIVVLSHAWYRLKHMFRVVRCVHRSKAVPHERDARRRSPQVRRHQRPPCRQSRKRKPSTSSSASRSVTLDLHTQEHAAGRPRCTATRGAWLVDGRSCTNGIAVGVGDHWQSQPSERACALVCSVAEYHVVCCVGGATRLIHACVVGLSPGIHCHSHVWRRLSTSTALTCLLFSPTFIIVVCFLPTKKKTKKRLKIPNNHCKHNSLLLQTIYC